MFSWIDLKNVTFTRIKQKVNQIVTRIVGITRPG